MEQKWIEEAKKTAELIEVPEALTPEAVKRRLAEKGRKKPRFYRMRGFRQAAAVILLFLLVGGGSLWIFRQAGSGRQSEDAAQQAKTVPEAGQMLAGDYRSPDSYEEIYEYLSASFYREYAAEADGSGETAAAAVPEAGETDGGAMYSQTNVRTEGVDEGDLVKTDGEYLYVIHTGGSLAGSVHIVRADGGEMEDVFRTEPVSDGIYRDYDSPKALYLDGNRMTVIYQCMDDAGEVCTVTAVYDITDREEPRLINTLEQDGAYSSSRRNGAYVYVFTVLDIVPGEEKNGIPHAEGAALDCGSLYYSEGTGTDRVLVAASVDTASPWAFSDTKAVYYEGSLLYVSGDSIYVAQTLADQTELFKLSYEEGRMEAVGSGRFLGYLKDPFSMDEYGGYLRIAATVTDSESGGQANSLYVLDEELRIAGYIHNIAPGEHIQSVRFLGDTGYFVTFRNVDPLFSVDLSDPQEPEILGELKVTGFSSYLHPYGDGKLLGIGEEIGPWTEAQEGLKLSMFDIEDPSQVTEEDKVVLEEFFYSPALFDHRAVLADTEKNCFGFLACGEEYRYLLYSYGEAGFVQELSAELPDGIARPDEVRGLYIGDTLYVANVHMDDGEGLVFAYDMESGELLGSLSLDAE